MGIAGDFCLIVVGAWLAGLLCHMARLPMALGYIGAGLALSHSTWGPSLADAHEIEMLADVGVALLLFTVGMEFPLPKLSQVGKVALIGTPIQVAATIALGWGLGKFWGWPGLHGVWLGALLALSSTTVVLRCLAQRGYLNSLASKVMIGILVVQDLCSVPIILILPQLGTPNSSTGLVLRTLGMGIAFVSLWIWMGRTLLPRAFTAIAHSRSRELFSLTVLAFGLGTGYLAYKLGLSLAFGAFLAGLVLAESDYAHQALHDVEPLRDLFTLIFFASVGLLVDPHWVYSHMNLLLPLGILGWVGKGLILAMIVRVFGYANVVPWATAFYMGQMGELAFVVARLGRQGDAIPEDVYKLLITLAALTMTLTPLIAPWTEPLYKTWRKFVPAKPFGPTVNKQRVSDEESGHTIVVGFGRVGKLVAGTLRSLNLPVVVMERDAAAAHRAQQKGYTVIFGESNAPTVLEAAGLERCRNIIFTYREGLTLQLSVELVNQLAPHVPILARAETLDQVGELRLYGAQQVVWPEMEGALEIVQLCLERFGVDAPLAKTFVDKVRQRHYWEVAEESDDEELRKLLSNTWHNECRFKDVVATTATAAAAGGGSAAS